MSKLKNLSLLIITFIVVLLLGVTVSNAVDKKGWIPSSAYTLVTGDVNDLGKTVHYLSAEDLYYGINLLCAEVEQEIWIASVKGEIAYTETDRITIDGFTAKSEKTGKTVTARENAILASILQNQRSGEYATFDWDEAHEAYLEYEKDPVNNEHMNLYKYAPYTESAVQNAVWKYLPTWNNKVGKTLGISGEFSTSGTTYHKDVANELIKEGEAYADSLGSMTFDIQDNTNYDNINITFTEEGEDTYVRFGPFNYTFGGNLTDIGVIGNNGERVGYATFGRYSGSTFEECSVARLKSGQNFYIIVRMDDGLTSIDRLEVTAKRGLKNAYFTVFTSNNNTQHIIAYRPSTDEERIDKDFDIDIPLVGNLNLRKTDETTGEMLANVGFTLQAKSGVKEGKYVSVQNGNAVYVDEPATIVTDANGILNIANLYPGTYELIETVNPNFGYEDLPKVINSNLEIQAGTTVTVEATNKKEYVRISGYVWEDIISGKMIERNDLYQNDENDDSDKLVQGVTVELINSTTGEVVDTAVTNADGQYQFNKVRIDDIPNLYVQFRYNGMTYTTVAVHTDVANGSKALEGDARPTFNEQYAIITQGQSNNSNEEKTYDLSYERGDHASSLILGENPVYGYEGATKPVNGVYDQYLITANTRDAYSGRNLDAITTPDQIRQEGIEEIPNINLGLLEREMPDLTLIQDVDNARLVLNRTEYTYSTEHTYNYGQKEEELNQALQDPDFNVTANFGIKYSQNQTYERAVYPSDVRYNELAGGDALEVYIRYQIILRNEATTLTSTIREISNYYDERYTIQNITDENGNVLTYEEQNYDGEGYNKINIDVSREIPPETQAYVYIEYKLNDEAIASILSNQMTLESVSEIISYSTVDSTGAVYAGIDKDSAPDNADITNTDTYEDDTDKAPSLILTPENSRQVAGTVFKDNAIERLLELEGYDKERVGNGTYEQDIENVLSNVRVDLYEVYDDGSMNPAVIYEGDEANEQNATSTTDQTGSYVLDGLVPGRYVIRYTYGNSSVIYDMDGNEVGTIDDVDNYKSTLFRTTRTEEEGAGNGIDTSAVDKSNTNPEWYKDETTNENGVRLSDARDNEEVVEDRMEEKDFTYSDVNEGDSTGTTEITADTPTFEITMDTNVDDLDNISEFEEQLKFVFNNVDFGIIERPIQDLQIRKEVSNIEIRLANGQVIISGDPRSQNIQYVGVLPDGSLHLEIDSEIIQGATIRIEYEIIVDNRNCEIDYNEEDYYYHGLVSDPSNSWSISTVEELFDYVDKGLQYELENQSDTTTWQVVDSTRLQSLIDQGRFDPDVANAIKSNNYNQILWTESFNNMTPGQENSVKLVLTRVLSNNEDDFTFPNDVEVNVVSKEKPDTSIPGNYDPVEGEPSEPDEDEIIVTITGPTGANRNFVPYIITGIGALAILVAGVVLIKTKVINTGKKTKDEKEE